MLTTADKATSATTTLQMHDGWRLDLPARCLRRRGMQLPLALVFDICGAYSAAIAVEVLRNLQTDADVLRLRGEISNASN